MRTPVLGCAWIGRPAGRIAFARRAAALLCATACTLVLRGAGGGAPPALAADQPPSAPGRARAAAAGEPSEPAWRGLAPGLELAVFAAGQAAIKVLRADPELWETVALAVTGVGGEPRSARAWGEEFGLHAVINAGMFDVDRRRHTAYFRAGEHVNNANWAQRGYRQAACFEPREEGLPRFQLLDLDDELPPPLADSYEIVVQNMRLIRKPGDNRWPAGTRPWSEACLGEDGQGRLLWIYCRQPHTMHDFNEILLSLPLGLVAAQHLEGGVQAQMWVSPAALRSPGGGREGPPAAWRAEQLGEAGWPVPDVLGLRPREAHRHAADQ